MNLEQTMSERESCPECMQPGHTNRNPRDISLFDLLKEDLRTHGGNLFAPGFIALAIHRFGNWRMGMSKPVRIPLTPIYRICHWWAKALWGIDIPYNTQIGRRFRIEHHGVVFIGTWAIGDDVTIRHSATIGLVRKDTNRAPIIGDRVDIGPGACVVGNIVIGDDCIVGPNTVQTTSMPDASACLGNPCRLVDRSVILGDD